MMLTGATGPVSPPPVSPTLGGADPSLLPPNAPLTYPTMSELQATGGYGQAWAAGPVPAMMPAPTEVAPSARTEVPSAPTDVPVSERGYAARPPLPRERPQGTQGAARTDAEWRGTPLSAVPGTSAREVPVPGASIRDVPPGTVGAEPGPGEVGAVPPQYERARPSDIPQRVRPEAGPGVVPEVRPGEVRGYGPQRGRPAVGAPDQYEPVTGRQPGYIRALPGQPTEEVPVAGAETRQAARPDTYAPGYVSSLRETEDYIARAAQRRGINPMIALTVFDREGRTNYKSQSPGEESYGPFQLNRRGGIGAEFERDNPGVDIRDPRNWRQTVDYALDRAVERGWGPWRGAAKAGIASRQGLPTPDQAVGRTMGYSPEFTGPPTGIRRGPPTDIGGQARPQSIEVLRDRGAGARVEGLSPQFSDRLARAIQDAEAATGAKAKITSLTRTEGEQAALYERHKAGGPLAAPPGRSRHQTGEAADIARGPVLDWLHQNAGRYGLEFLKGDAFHRDPVHIQLSGRTGVQVFRPGIRAPVSQEPAPMPVQPSAVATRESPAASLAGAIKAPSEAATRPSAPPQLAAESGETGSGAPRQSIAEYLYGTAQSRRKGKRNV